MQKAENEALLEKVNSVKHSVNEYLISYRNAVQNAGLENDNINRSEEWRKVSEALADLEKSISDGGSGNFVNDWSWSSFFHYLDSLTIAQEASLLHFCLFFVLFL